MSRPAAKKAVAFAIYAKPFQNASRSIRAARTLAAPCICVTSGKTGSASRTASAAVAVAVAKMPETCASNATWYDPYASATVNAIESGAKRIRVRSAMMGIAESAPSPIPATIVPASETEIP